jgi:hypothetical protein
MTEEFYQFEANAYKGLTEAGGKPDQYYVLGGEEARKVCLILSLR